MRSLPREVANAFGVEIDQKGRIFSGHNGGNTRGFHYVQGGYLRKGFSKHGPLSNPYAFGYFSAMPHHDVQRFTHTFLIYDGAALPANYHGKLFGVEPLQGRVVVAEMQPYGSSFRTEDESRPLISDDDWFRPVDIKAGPDGAVYVADWYDGQVNHYRNHEGQIDPSNGRVYRLQRPDAQPVARFDLAKLASHELVEHLSHPNKWIRQTALRVLGDRRDKRMLPRLKALLAEEQGQFALEALWALNLTGGMDQSTALELLRHADPHVRVWTVRLLGDRKEVSSVLASELRQLSTQEQHVEVRQQLACSARRLPVTVGLPIVRGLLRHQEDATDVYQPLLLWWTIETFCRSDPQAVIDLWKEKELWKEEIVKETILHRPDAAVCDA